MKIFSTAILTCCVTSCLEKADNVPILHLPEPVINTVADIEAPQNFKRIGAAKNSFDQWLRDISVRKDRTVYLYNGLPKENQTVQYVVLDLPIGKKDLQQCADAVIRMRAEYLFAQKRFREIVFSDNAGKQYRWEGGDNSQAFGKYLDLVFGWCGSASLEKSLKPARSLSQIKAGDVFIHGGFPGHAMIVMDIALNDKKEMVYLLAQGFMPAQDIHIVQNPVNKKLSPWYEVKDLDSIITPEWIFSAKELRTW